MKTFLHTLTFFILMPLVSASSGASSNLSDEAITRILIRESIRGFSGSCPCPYSLDYAGQRCGNRSVWDKAEKVSPLCFASDVTREMIKKYRARRSKTIY